MPKFKTHVFTDVTVENNDWNQRKQTESVPKYLLARTYVAKYVKVLVIAVSNSVLI